MIREQEMKKYILLSLILLVSIQLRTKTYKTTVKNVSYYEYAYYELIRREGIQLTSYKCPAGCLSIGVGSVSSKSDIITLQEAKDQAKARIQLEYDWLSLKIPKLKHNQKLALCLFIYNFGRTYFINSDLYPLIINNKNPSKEWIKHCLYKDYKTGKYIHSDNLLESRKRELKLFQNQIDSIENELPRLKDNTILQYIKTTKN